MVGQMIMPFKESTVTYLYFVTLKIVIQDTPLTEFHQTHTVVYCVDL